MHTFRNEGPADARVITCFERFFLEYGVDVNEAGAFETSVSEAMITRVIEGCAQFGMILAPTRVSRRFRESAPHREAFAR